MYPKLVHVYKFRKKERVLQIKKLTISGLIILIINILQTTQSNTLIEEQQQTPDNYNYPMRLSHFSVNIKNIAKRNISIRL